MGSRSALSIAPQPTPEQGRAPRPAARGKPAVRTGKGIERANAILEAAREIFANAGYAGLSMRGIAGRLGISLSNVQHYYPSKDALVEALLLHMLDGYKAAVDRMNSQMARASPLERFRAAIGIFVDEASDPLTVGVFVEIWALARRHRFAASVAGIVQARQRKQMVHLIAGLLPRASKAALKTRAALMIMHLEGLIRTVSCLQPGEAGTAALKDAARKSFEALATADYL
ncbi:MAG: TetR family transcriptional regulator [Nevskia sp.]|nr:TetR family transcriptional regulator [Nevskia sp.]